MRLTLLPIARIAAGLLLATFLMMAAAPAQSSASDNLNRIKFTGNDLPGYTLAFEGDRDWSVFDATLGAAADCLKAKPIGNGREQLWKSDSAGQVRVDYVVFDSPGQAASAARAAALMLNNATERMSGDETVGDASWRTIAGSTAIIVERGPAVFYLTGNGDANVSEAQLVNLAQTLIGRTDALNLTVTPAQFACDVETYIGLGLVSDAKAASDLRAQAGRLSQSDAAARRQSADALKALIQDKFGKGIDREAAANLLRSLP